MVDCFGMFFMDVEIVWIYFGYDVVLLVLVICVYIEMVDGIVYLER